MVELLPDDDVLVLRENIGWQAEANSIAEVPTARDSQAGYTIDSMEPIYVEDLADEDRFASDKLLQEQNIVSGITVPIGSAEPPWGLVQGAIPQRLTFEEETDPN